MIYDQEPEFWIGYTTCMQKVPDREHLPKIQAKTPEKAPSGNIAPKDNYEPGHWQRHLFDENGKVI